MAQRKKILGKEKIFRERALPMKKNKNVWGEYEIFFTCPLPVKRLQIVYLTVYKLFFRIKNVKHLYV